MQKKDILPRTLESKIMQDGLNALGQLEADPNTRQSYFLVGGAAVQSYLPKKFYRPTSDLDVCTVRPINNRTDFKEFAKRCIEYLRDNGYEIEFKKSSQNFKIIAKDQRSEDIAFLEFSRRNIKKYKEMEKRIERELENSRYKNIANTKLSVVSPEDITIPKLVRGTNSLVREPSIKEIAITLYHQIQEESPLRDILNYVIQERAKADSSDNVILKERARLAADFYDIFTLSQFTGFNKKELKISAEKWDKTKDLNEWKFLVSLLGLPFHK